MTFQLAGWIFFLKNVVSLYGLPLQLLRSNYNSSWNTSKCGLADRIAFWSRCVSSLDINMCFSLFFLTYPDKDHISVPGINGALVTLWSDLNIQIGLEELVGQNKHTVFQTKANDVAVWVLLNYSLADKWLVCSLLAMRTIARILVI